MAAVIHVDPSGTGNSISIQGGINMAGNGDTVLVCPSRYYETIDYLGKNITVGSFFLLDGDTTHISQTIIDGNHSHNRLVKFTHGETRDARLVGFTITNGFDDTATATIRVSGLGIYIENSSPSIEFNHIVNSEFGEWYISGGGIALINSGAAIRNNIIMHNEYAYEGGGIYASGGTGLLIEGNYIAHHYLISGYGVAEGGGIYLMHTQGTLVRNNLVESNETDFGDGVSIAALNCDSAVLINNVFRNSTGNGSFCEIEVWGGTVNLVNNLIINYLIPSTYLLWMHEGTVKLVNSTLVNQTNYSIKQEYGSLECENSILYGPGDTIAGHQFILSGGTASFTNCDIEGDTAAFEIYGNSSVSVLDNIDSDPGFTGDSLHPFSLSDNSACINRGNPDTMGLMLPEHDLAGNDRIVRGVIDIGAYENQQLTGIWSARPSDVFWISPNLVNDNLDIIIPGKSDKAILMVYTSTGQLISRVEFTKNTSISFNRFAPGIYVVSITSGNLRQAKKILKH
jgi:hypothetical protein